MVEFKKRIDNDDHYCGTNNPKYIVIHDTGNYTDSDEGNANYFCTGTRDASAHLFVDDDSCTQVVEYKDGAFHCGDGNNKYGINNNNSIGIEMCRVNGVVTETTENNTIEIVKMLMKQYNIDIDHVVRHYDASRKNCPASFNLDGKWTRWNKFKAKLNPNYKVKCTGFSITGDKELDKEITLTATAEPLSDSLYKFWVCDRSTGKWQVIRDYASDIRTKYKLEKATQYTFVVHVKHKNSTNEYDDFKSIDFKIDNKKTYEELEKERDSYKSKLEAIQKIL